MLERLALLILLVGAAWLAYTLWYRWRLRRTATHLHREAWLADFQRGKPAVVLFTADFCHPCKTQQRPALERLQADLSADALQIFQVDVEQQPDVAARWGVLSLPTTYILDGAGQPRQVNHGVTSAEKLKRQLEALSS
jgi:thioredoxin-like negative regulator of GroEL